MKNTKVALLGPEGTYSHFAAKKYGGKDLLFCTTISEAIDAVSCGLAKEAVLPFENSIQGTVLETLDGIFEKGLIISKQIVVDIHHSISSLKRGIKVKDVSAIFSHPQALGQCKHYLRKHFPKATLITTASTSAGQKKIKEEGITDALAIGPSFGAKMYGLNILNESIEDEKNNQTMFVVVSKSAKKPGIKSSLLSLVLKEDKEGILHDILSVFKDRGINLSKIESRPSRKRLGLYMFYVKIDTPRNDKRMPEIIKKLKRMGSAVTIMSA